ncbi:MAG: 2Fe-2S iron-sulfur cluster binding domain-containing protein [Methylohalobius sp.]|nr:2Fe-2S iron-sulfur cluster binding domain-containing protein [Methylohalobius sp.]
MPGYLRLAKRRKAKVRLTVLPFGHTVVAESGTCLLDAILEAGFTLAQLCGRRASCGSCRVRVVQGGRSLSKIYAREHSWLVQSEVESSLRLACQALLGPGRQVVIELVHP